ncbi:hypothetical protein KAT51_04150 [bacterium]|nr:hypothetical protein [bacterium]
MKIGFKKSMDLPEYRNVHSCGRVCFLDGQVKDIPDTTARELLRDFPDNFYSLEELAEPRELAEPPEDKMIRKQEAKTKSRKKRKR